MGIGHTTLSRVGTHKHTAMTSHWPALLRCEHLKTVPGEMGEVLRTGWSGRSYNPSLPSQVSLCVFGLEARVQHASPAGLKLMRTTMSVQKGAP